MYVADHGISLGRVRQLFWGIVASIVLGVSFLVLKVVEYAAVPYQWDDHAYGSIVWHIIGFHSAHVASVVLKSVVVAVLAARGFFDAERLIGVQVNGLYWHFVVGVWVPLCLVLYWAPRVMQRGRHAWHRRPSTANVAGRRDGRCSCCGVACCSRRWD